MAVANSWHLDIKTWKERNEFLLKNEIMADCKFIIIDGTNKTTIPAHKYVLGGNSPEFYNLFYLMDSSNEIPIEDTSADNFTKFLEYLYTEKTVLTMENVEDLLKLAKRYSVTNFEAFCGEFLYKNVKQETALSVMDKYSDYEMPNLMDKCATLISNDQLIFESPAFLTISIKTLTDLLKSEKLTVKELTIFNGVNKWAENFCKENNLEVNSDNKRLTLKPVLKYIRFASMTCNDFALCTMNPSVLTPAEIVQIMQCIATNGKVKCEFSAKERPTTSVKRTFNLILDDSKIGIENRMLDGRDILKISVDTPIQLHGIGIFGRTDIVQGIIEMSIKLKDENETVLNQSSININFDGTAKTYDLCFDKSMMLAPGKSYKIAVVRDGNTRMFEYYSSMNFTNIINREVDGVHFNVYSSNICTSIIFSD